MPAGLRTPAATAWEATGLATLAAGGSAAVLTGSTTQMADRLLRRRETCGVSYLTVNSAYPEELAPVIELLAGR